MRFTPTGCDGTTSHHFLTIGIIQTQMVKHYRTIDGFLNLICFQINLQNQSTKAAILTLKLLTKLYSQQFVLKVNQSSIAIFARKKEKFKLNL